MFVLDTNVISELIRPKPSPDVLQRVRGFPSADLYTTVLSEAEIRYGVAILPPSRKRSALETQVGLIFTEDFHGRILPFDSAAAQEYANLVARRRTEGRPISLLDAQIAAIVRSRRALLVFCHRNKLQ